MTKRYPLKDKTQWALVLKAPLTASGCDEIIARTVLKKDLYKLTNGQKSFSESSSWAFRKLGEGE